MAKNKTDTEVVELLREVLNDFEPKWTTHPMSIWNRIRRKVIKIETGKEISKALSWDHDKQDWLL